MKQAPQAIRLAIADDHPIVIDVLKAILAASSEVEVVCSAEGGEALLGLLPSQPVDLVLLDVQMPGMSGIETAGAIRQQYPEVKILMLTMSNEPEYIRAAMEQGANGYVLKNTDKAELLQAIAVLMAGGSWYSKAVGEALLNDLRPKAAAPASPPKPQVKLTTREKEILRLILEEQTTQEIADTLFISVNTVETHRKNLMSKAGARNLAGLVKFGLQQGLSAEGEA